MWKSEPCSLNAVSRGTSLQRRNQDQPLSYYAFHVKRTFELFKGRDPDNWFKMERKQGRRSKFASERGFHVKQLATAQNVC
jgi:hypothetical protein